MFSMSSAADALYVGNGYAMIFLLFQGLEPGDTGTVRRRQHTVVTPKMAMESFRYSFMSGKSQFLI